MEENKKAAQKKKISHAIIMVVLILLFLMFIFPFILVIINAFKTKGDIMSDPMALVGSHGFIVTNFSDAMKKMNFTTSFTNSLIITVSATIGTILLSAMTAFVIVRNNWKACKLLFTLMIASMVIPFQVLMIPLVSLYGGIFGVLNSRVTLILMHIGFSLSMATFMFHGAIHTNIPLELEEAAFLDGCSNWQTYWKIVFPLLKPTVITLTLLSVGKIMNSDFGLFYNVTGDMPTLYATTDVIDNLLPSLVLGRKELYTLPIATQAFYGTYSTDMGLVMAALLLAMLPILILYLFLQRYIVEGVTSGAVKG
jgi:raffinose/stachyose/melibiose transport system permease protein